MIRLEIYIAGVPKPDPRPRFRRFGGAYKDMTHIAEWVGDLDRHLAECRPDAPLEAPIKVCFEFYLPRPKKHYGTGRNSEKLLPSAPKWPTTQRQGDWDNLAKLVQDRMTKAGFWVDDSHVTSAMVNKQYAIDQCGCRITVFAGDDSSTSHS